MELIEVRHKRAEKSVVVAPLGDIQWTGPDGATAIDHLRRYIDRALALDALFLGMGDYTDFASPSNRMRLKSAALYDTSEGVIEAASDRLVYDLYENILAPTTGRWVGLLEGHHFFESDGRTSDMLLANLLKTRFLGTSCYVHFVPCDVTLWAHHGRGNAQLPAGPLNKLYHTAAGLHGADVYLMGHTTKLSTVRVSRPQPTWGPEPDLTHRDVHFVNTGGFSKSNIVGHRRGSIPRGDYAEQGMMTPSPLSAPLIHIDTQAKRLEDRVRVEV